MNELNIETIELKQNDAAESDEELLVVEVPTEIQGGNILRLLCKLASYL